MRAGKREPTSLSQVYWLISFSWFTASPPCGELGLFTTDMHFSSSLGFQQHSLQRIVVFHKPHNCLQFDVLAVVNRTSVQIWTGDLRKRLSFASLWPPQHYVSASQDLDGIHRNWWLHIFLIMVSYGVALSNRIYYGLSPWNLAKDNEIKHEPCKSDLLKIMHDYIHIKFCSLLFSFKSLSTFSPNSYMVKKYRSEEKYWKKC